MKASKLETVPARPLISSTWDRDTKTARVRIQRDVLSRKPREVPSEQPNRYFADVLLSQDTNMDGLVSAVRAVTTAAFQGMVLEYDPF